VLIRPDVQKTLIFGKTKYGVERLGKELQARGFRADALHGGKSQGQRKRALDNFRSNQVSVLVATDVAARGIDVKDITHVINYDTPQTYDDYVHRIGRAGRAGQLGYALTFVEK
jgi:ATP-dependent RNA helicase RhlE